MKGLLTVVVGMALVGAVHAAPPIGAGSQAPADAGIVTSGLEPPLTSTSALQTSVIATLFMKNWPTSGPSPLRIVALEYDSRDEYVEIANHGSAAHSLSGWRVVSTVGSQTFPFPLGYVLEAGNAVRVHSGPEGLSRPPGDLLWTGRYIWTNRGDEAELYDAGGNLVDSQCYKAACP